MIHEEMEQNMQQKCTNVNTEISGGADDFHLKKKR